MNLLAIDCSCSVLSVAVKKGSNIYYEETDANMKQSELVMDFIDSKIKEAFLQPKDLNGVLCMGGPGSFTGLRIGYSIAKGLALSLSIPFAVFPTLECISFNLLGFSLPVIKARKNAYFYAFFRDNQRIKEDSDNSTDHIIQEISQYSQSEEIILTGPGANELFDSLPDNKNKNIILDNKKSGFAKELILIAEQKNIFNKTCDLNLYSGPEYIRKSDAELNF